MHGVQLDLRTRSKIRGGQIARTLFRTPYKAVEDWALVQRQGLPLEAKVRLSESRIRDWFDYWDGRVFVTFSGGKDSTVLLHMVRRLYPDVPAVFVDTGLEYPEIKDFVRDTENVEILRPKLSFIQVIKKYGYPVGSKKIAHMVKTLKRPTPHNKLTRDRALNGWKKGKKTSKAFILTKRWRKLIDAPFMVSDRCCAVMKKEPIHRYVKRTERVPYVGLMASEGRQRRFIYLKQGCNPYHSTEPKSSPLGFWTDRDIWEYIKKYKVPYCSIYDTGVKRTGCMFCMFGVHLEKEPNRFQVMARTHPKIYEYCMNELRLGAVLDYIGVEYRVIREPGDPGSPGRIADKEKP